MSVLRNIVNNIPTPQEESEEVELCQPILDDFLEAKPSKLEFIINKTKEWFYLNFITNILIEKQKAAKQEFQKELERNKIRSLCHYFKDFNDPNKTSLFEFGPDGNRVREFHKVNRFKMPYLNKK